MPFNPKWMFETDCDKIPKKELEEARSEISNINFH